MSVRFACLALLLVVALPVESAVQLKGWLEFVQKVGIRALENGVVREVPVSTGQHVKQGDLLLRMDQREAQARLLEAKARVARSRISTEKAQRQLDRTLELYDRGLIAQEELKDAELELAAATAEEESAKAFEAAAQVALDHTELRAPFDGIVVTRNAWEGEVVYKTLQQEPLLVIAPDGFMLARALVTANVLRSVQPGQKAGVNILGAMREARVYGMGVEPVRVELQGAVYALDLIFERRPEERLRPSETVQIVLP
jgi:RND family efflux transporter MFP subunit